MLYNDNHSIAYCLLGYLCAYYRHYYPIEFITAALNDAANDEDTINGTKYAGLVGVKVTSPKFGISRSTYAYDKEKKIISKGLASIKYLSAGVSDELYELSKQKEYETFVDLLKDIVTFTSLDTRQVDILIKIDFFSDFGNQRELLYIVDLFFNTFKKGEAKQISKEKVKGLPFEDAIIRHSNGKTKDGKDSKNYVVSDINSILKEAEISVKNIGMKDLSIEEKVRNFAEVAGYVGFTSGEEKDRRKLYVMDVYELRRKSDDKQFGYSVVTKSIGSGKESRFTVFNRVFDKNPVKKGDIITCIGWTREGQYFTMTNYEKGAVG